MARVDSLGNFLTDVADAIREKKGTSETIQASDFDTEIENLPSGGANLEDYFVTTIDSNINGLQPLKKYPDIIVSDNVTTLQQLFGFKQIIGEAPKVICNDNVTNLRWMFTNTEYVTAADLSGLNTSNVTNLQGMFTAKNQNDTALKSIFFGDNFNTAKVTSMREMFIGRRGLTTLNLSMFETSSLENAIDMFSSCINLAHIDMRKFDFTNIASTTRMFGSSASSGVPDNCEIIVADQTQKDWINTNFSRLTNVKTVAEYEAEQSE